MLDDKISELSKKTNLVFVGSTALKLRGINIIPKDIDIVVTDLTGLENCIEYTTTSKFSSSGKRAFIRGEINIDIFLEDQLPHFNLINGYKCVTIESTKDYYLSIYDTVDEYWKKKINEKLNLLGNATKQKHRVRDLHLGLE